MLRVAKNVLKPAVIFIYHAQKNGVKMAAFVQKAKYFTKENVLLLISAHVTAVEEVIKMAKHINKTVIHGMYLIVEFGTFSVMEKKIMLYFSLLISKQSTHCK
jgi:hypothetical protein